MLHYECHLKLIVVLVLVPPGAPPTKVRIVLLSLPGKGKSSTGNTILGSEQFEAAVRFNPVTEETVSKSVTVEGGRSQRWTLQDLLVK